MPFKQNISDDGLFCSQTKGQLLFLFSTFFLPHLKRVLFQERGTDAITDTNIQQVFHGLSYGHIWKQGK